MSKKFDYDYTVFIGRFQPFHAGHYSVVKTALENSENLIIVLGGANAPRTGRNPFNDSEREQIIRWTLSHSENKQVKIIKACDFTYNNTKWVASIQSGVDDITKNFLGGTKPRIALIGHGKDESSFYLKMFPQWESIKAAGYVGPDRKKIDATTLREAIFDLHENDKLDILGKNPLLEHFFANSDHADQIIAFAKKPSFAEPVAEAKWNASSRAAWAKAPYPPTFSTTDSVVTMGGHILLVERRNRPGKGLWAIPGGYTEQNITLVDNMLKELKEETGIDMPDSIILGSIKNTMDADDPWRSERGRIISKVYHVDLKFNNSRNIVLPKVKGGDDAAKAKWFTLDEFMDMRPVMFEDHFSVVTQLLGL